MLFTRKPRGAVKVRRGHPLASRVLAAYVFNDHHRLRDVSGRGIIMEGVNSPTISTVKGLRGLSLDGVSQHCRISYEYELLSNLDGFSVFARFHATGGDDMVWSIHGPTGTQRDLQLYSGSGVGLMRFADWDSGASLNAYTTGIQNTTISACVVHDDIDNANTQRYYTKKDGVHKTTTGSATTHSITESRYILIGADADAATDHGYGILGNWFGGIIEYLYFVKGVVSESQAKTLIDNPWGLLEPQHPELLFAPATANDDGVGSSSGSSTASAIGSSLVESEGVSSGSATTAGVGSALFDGVGDSTGSATTAGVGTTVLGSIGDSTGSATTTGVGSALFDGVGTSTGSATTTGVGSALFDGVGTSTGSATTTGVGSALFDGVGDSTGSAVTTGVGLSLVNGVGDSAGSATTTGVGLSLVNADSTSSGSATTTGVGSALFNGVGSSAGSSTAAAVAGGVGSNAVSVGTATVAGEGSSLVESDGASSGSAVTTGVGLSLVDSVGSSTGSATTTGVGSALFDGVGSSTGSATTVGVGATTGNVATSAGLATVIAIGSSVVKSVSSSTGLATVTGISSALVSNAGKVENVHLTLDEVDVIRMSLIDADRVRVTI